MTFKSFLTTLLFLLLASNTILAEDGYRLWLRYDKIQNETVRKTYQKQIKSIWVEGDAPILKTALKELRLGLSGLLDKPQLSTQKTRHKKGIVAGVLGQSSTIDAALSEEEANQIQAEGFLIKKKNHSIIIAAKDEKGVLYGAFHLVRMVQMQQSLANVYVLENPKIKLRVLNHWDNLDGTVERGYAGFSIWNWHQLPEYIDQRYIDYARANASIGINGAVVTNVNANSLIFRTDYIKKAAALADVFRPYGIKLYLTARFSSPMELGKLVYKIERLVQLLFFNLKTIYGTLNLSIRPKQQISSYFR